VLPRNRSKTITNFMDLTSLLFLVFSCIRGHISIPSYNSTICNTVIAFYCRGSRFAWRTRDCFLNYPVTVFSTVTVFVTIRGWLNRPKSCKHGCQKHEPNRRGQRSRPILFIRLLKPVDKHKNRLRAKLRPQYSQ
jgi:hypothetical protein